MIDWLCGLFLCKKSHGVMATTVYIKLFDRHLHMTGLSTDKALALLWISIHMQIETMFTYFQLPFIIDIVIYKLIPNPKKPIYKNMQRDRRALYQKKGSDTLHPSW